MARSCFCTHFLLVFFASFLLTSESTLVKAAPPNHRVAGVFMLIEGGQYTMNFSAATAACLFLNVTIATRAQMERAVQLGLETCKFGWIHGKIAAIPRLKSDSNCGQGKIGLVTWRANETMRFGVFCFNASDLEKTPKASTAHPRTYTSSTALSRSSTPTTALMLSTSRSPTTVATKAPEPTSIPSAFTLLVRTTPSARISSTSPPFKPLSTSKPTSRSQLTTSNPSVVPFPFSTVTHVSSESVLPRSVSSTQRSLGVVPTVLITLGTILLLLTAAGAAWYYKLKRNTFTCWSPAKQKDDIETEMWKHTKSELDLHSEHEEEEAADRMYSSEIMLCVNPNMKTNSSE